MATDTEAFMKTPLATWVKTFYDDDGKPLDFRQLCDGVFLHSMWLQIDNHPMYSGVSQAGDVTGRLRNLNIIVHNVKMFYEDVLGQVLVMHLPNIVSIAKYTHDESSLKEMQTLLLLILGCAVQCEHKQKFIEKIKTLDLDVQHAIVECIQQVTDNPQAVWTSEWGELNSLPDEGRDHMYSLLVHHLKHLAKERDDFAQKLVNMTLEQEVSSSDLSDQNSNSKSHLGVELADARSRLRRLQQEMEEKLEIISEQREETDRLKDTVSRLRQENLDLIQDARTAKAYRDEIDILKERVWKVDRLESEIQRYRDKMNELEFFRSRVEELREDNRILSETKSMLEEQLEGCRKRSDHVHDLEADLLKFKAQISEILLEKEIDRERIQHLMEENAQLHVEKKSSLEEIAHLQAELSHLRSQGSSCQEQNLMEQLNSDAQTRVLQLELENKRLHLLVDSCKRSSENGCITAEKDVPTKDEIISSEESKLQNRKEDLDPAAKLEKALSEMTSITNEKNSLLENIKSLQSSLLKVPELENQKAELEKQMSEFQKQLESKKIDTLKMEQMEQSLSSLSLENQRLQRSLETTQHRLQESQQESQCVESENQKLNTTLESLRKTVQRMNDVERENTNLEAENHKLAQEKRCLEKETQRLKHAIDIKDATIDEVSSKLSTLELENKKLSKEMEKNVQLNIKLKDFERENKELTQQVSIDKKTLQDLRQDLVNEKIKNQELASELDRIASHLQHTTDLWKSEQEKSSKEINQNPVKELNNESKARETDQSVICGENLAEVSSEEKLTKQDRETPLTKSSELIEMASENSESNNIDSSACLTKKIRELKDTIMHITKKNVSLEEEVRCYKNQLMALREHTASLQGQMTSEEQRRYLLSKQNSTLQSQQAKLEVEYAFVCSQNASMTAQNTTLQNKICELETEKEKLNSQNQELQASHLSLLKDHQVLEKLHEQLSSDYEALAANYSCVKTAHKQLKSENQAIKEKLQEATFSNEMIKLREVLQEESCHSEAKNVKMEHDHLKEQWQALKDEHEKLSMDYKCLQAQLKMVKSANNELKLKNTELQGDLSECKNEASSLELHMSKLSTQYELLSQLNSILEEERQCVMSHISVLLMQYHNVVSSLVQDKEIAWKEQLDALQYQKDKLSKMMAEYSKKLDRAAVKDLVSTCAPQMRRTRSEHFSGLLKSMERLKSSLPDSTDNCIYNKRCSDGMLEIKTQNGHGTLGSLDQDDQIPVRDVGPHVIPADKHEGDNKACGLSSSINSANAGTQIQLPPKGESRPPAHHMTVENHTTVNLINQHSCPTEQTNGFNTSPRFSRMPAARHSMYSRLRSSDVLSGSPFTYGGLRGSIHGTQASRSLALRGLRSSSSQEGLYEDRPQTDENRHRDDKMSPTKDKRTSAIWYEYGCV